MARSRCPSLAAFVALICAGLSSTLSAQSWEITDEIDFAKSMARYRLFDLASEHLDNLSRSDFPDDDRLAILYARATLFRIAGEYAIGEETQLDYLGKAATSYDDFLSRARETHDQFGLAQGEAAAVQRSIGKMLAAKLATGDAAEGTKAKAEDAFRKAIERLLKEFERQRSAFESIDQEGMEPEQIDEAMIAAYRPLYELTATYYEFSQLYDASDFNRESYLTNAYETAEEFLWEVPSTAFISYQTYYYAGLAYLGLGETADGFDRLEFIVDPNTGLPSWPENDPDIPLSWARQVTQEVEKAYLAIARAHNDAGQYAETEKQLSHLEEYYKKYADRGCTRGPLGQECLIELGRALHLQGKPEGMATLQRIANEFAQDRVGALAASAIGAILEESGMSATSVIPATVWQTAAKSAQAEGRFFDSLDNYHKTLAALGTISDPERQTTLAVDAWNSIGRLYRGENRLLESAAAFEAGLAVPKRSTEDAKRLGSALFNTLQRRYRETKSKEDERKKNNMMTTLKNLGLEEMGFLLARDDFEAARVIPADQADARRTAFKAAIKQLKTVKKKDKNYERAMILLARAEAEQGDFKQALKRLEDFFKRIENPKYAIGGTEQDKIKNRKISSCEATYYKATYLSSEQQYDKVLSTLTGFEESFATQTKFFPQVNYLRLRAYLALSPAKITAAEQLFETEFAAGRIPMEAQYFLSLALIDQAKAAEESGDTSTATSLRARAAEHLFEYCKNSGYTSYSNLRVAADNFMAVGMHERAEEVFKKIVEQFGSKAAYADRIDRIIKRGLAAALLAQDKFLPAADLYRDLLVTFANKDLRLMKEAARAFGGRVDIDENGRGTEVSGSGDYKEAVELWDLITKQGFTKDQKYTLGWWEAKYYAIYTRYRAKDISPEWLTDAKAIASNLDDTSLSFFRPKGSTEIDWDEVFQEQGPKVAKEWGARYTYLLDRLR